MQFAQQGRVWISFVQGISSLRRVRNIAHRVVQKLRQHLITAALEKWDEDAKTSKARRRAVSRAIVRLRHSQLVRMFDEWDEFRSCAVQERASAAAAEAQKELQQEGNSVGTDLHALVDARLLVQQRMTTIQSMHACRYESD